MFGFLKAGMEYNNMAKAMNAMNIMIQEILTNLDKSSDPEIEFGETVLILAYFARQGVYERLEKYNWPETGKITVPTINRSQITLAYALQQTIGKMFLIADKLNMKNEVDEVMNRGDLFFRINDMIPEHSKKDI